MARIDINTNEIKTKVLPHLNEALTKLETASPMSNILGVIPTLKKTDVLINNQKEKLENLIKLIQSNIESYEALDNENIDYISKCLVENVDILIK